MSFYDVRIAGIVFSLYSLLVVGMAGQAHCQVGASTTPVQTVKGDVLNIEGEVYTVKDITGHETSIHVNQDTKMEDRIKVGDKIEAQITSDGHASSMRVQIPDVAPSKPGSPTIVP